MSNKKNLIRQQNLTNVKKFLFGKGKAAKIEMSKKTNISIVTINSLVNQLINENFFKEGELEKQQIGRPAYTYHFNYDKEHFLLISIQENLNGLKKKLVIVGKIVNLKGELKAEKIFDFNLIEEHFFIDKIKYFLDLGILISKITLSFPGKIYNGKVISSWYNLFDNWEFKKEVAKITSIPFLIQNDANLLTIGYKILKKIDDSETIVGIFYPKNSMPGITILDKGHILEGGHNLAGEAKYLPNFLTKGRAQNTEDMTVNLIELIELYNVIIAPTTIVISADSIDNKELIKTINDSKNLTQQINNPKLLFADNFQEALTVGLFWLATFDSDYQL